MKRRIRILSNLVGIVVVFVTLGFGASQVFAKSKSTCPPPNVTCTTDHDCTLPCKHFNGGTGVCSNGCCECFLS